MTLNELKEHIWLCEDPFTVIRISSSEEVDKLEELKKNLTMKLENRQLKWKTTGGSQIIKK